MQSAVAAAVGERVFVDRDVRHNLCGIELRCDSVRVTRDGLGEATVTTTIQGKQLQGWNKGKT